MTWRPGEGVSENPLNRNPLVRFGGGFALYDPRTILDYLETVRPVPALMPSDPAEVFRVKTWEALAEGVNAAAVDLYIAGARGEPAEDPGGDGDWIARRRTRVRDGLATAAAMLGRPALYRGRAILAQRYRARGHAGASRPATARRGLADGLAGARRLVRRNPQARGRRRGSRRLNRPSIHGFAATRDEGVLMGRHSKVPHPE